MTFRPDFACTEPGHVHPAHVARTALRDEARRELAYRRDVYPRMIIKGTLTRDVADRQTAVIAAIAADMAQLLDTGLAVPRAMGRDGGDPFTWSDKVHELRREIALRRRFYPEWVKKGTLTPRAARDQLAAMLGLHWRYWVDGYFSAADFATREHAARLDVTLPDWRGPHPDIVPEPQENAA